MCTHAFFHASPHLSIDGRRHALSFSPFFPADTPTASQLCGKEEALTKQRKSIRDNYNSLLDNYTEFTLLSRLPPLIFTKIFTAAGTQL